MLWILPWILEAELEWKLMEILPFPQQIQGTFHTEHCRQQPGSCWQLQGRMWNGNTWKWKMVQRAKCSWYPWAFPSLFSKVKIYLEHSYSFNIKFSTRILVLPLQFFFCYPYLILCFNCFNCCFLIWEYNWRLINLAMVKISWW